MAVHGILYCEGQSVLEMSGSRQRADQVNRVEGISWSLTKTMAIFGAMMVFRKCPKINIVRIEASIGRR